MDKPLALALHAAWASHRELFLFSSLGCDSVERVVSALSRLPIEPQRASFLRSVFVSERVVPFSVPEGCRAIFHTDPEYPGRFLEFKNRPFVLYARGTCLSDFSSSVSIVGSRNITAYGELVTTRFSREIGTAGFSVVSWGAFGVDAVAHRGALSVSAKTAVFLGNGLSAPYPSKNRTLFREIVEKGGTIVTPFSFSARPDRHHFPIRNALVAAFSDGTLVTEAAIDSGSVITVKYALEFGRETFAVPGDVTRGNSEGANRLIRDGMAKCVTTPDDVISEFTSRNLRPPPPSNFPVPTIDDPVLRELVFQGECDANLLSERLRLPLSEVLSRLTCLELEGLVIPSGGKYRANAVRQSVPSR